MTQTLKEKLEALPEPLQQEVEDFVDFSLQKRGTVQANFNFSWAGGLRELKEETTSVALQHKASEWRQVVLADTNIFLEIFRQTRVGRYDKLLIRILRGTSDANIDFGDLCQLLSHLGFYERVRGSHYTFRRSGVEERINLQRDGSKAKPYTDVVTGTGCSRQIRLGRKRC